MARYDNRRYSAEMPPGYSPRDLIELLLDTSLDGTKDGDLTPRERWRLRVYREQLADADAKLTGSGDIDQRRRTDLFYQAVNSICAIMADRIEKNPIALRQMTAAHRRRAVHEKNLVSEIINDILVEVAKPVCKHYPNDKRGQIAGLITNTLIKKLDADERLRGKEKLFPRKQQAVSKRLKAVWHLVRTK